MPVLERLPLLLCLQNAPITLYQVKRLRWPNAPDFVGQLGAVHALDALVFGLLALAGLALLLGCPLPLGRFKVATQVDD